jgi:hypothetical protein
MKYFLLIFLSLSIHFCFATHNKGGRIEVDHVGINHSDLRFKITITTYTKTSSVHADRPTLDSVYFGDGSSPVIFVRSQRIDVTDNISLNTYINYHTYAGPGTYVIRFSDPNLNAGIINIPGSVAVPFYLETTIVINPFMCDFYSPHLLSIPIFKATMGKDFSMSRSSYDPNWDSLSYELINNLDSGYWIPPGVSVNPLTGEFKWEGDSMSVEGEYAFQIVITKWNNGINMGHVMEHFQILLYTTPNINYGFDTSLLPPDLTSHVSPGDTFNLSVKYTDSDSLYSFQIFRDFMPLHFIDSMVADDYYANVQWIPTITDVRTTPFYFIVRGREDLTYKIFVDGTPVDTCRAIIGINEIENIDFNFFPNPVSDAIHFVINESNSRPIKIYLYDVLGKLHLEKTIVTNETINVSNLKTGMYLMRIVAGEKIISRKLVKL